MIKAKMDQVFDPKIHPPRLHDIPEQLVQSGKFSKIDLSDFLEISDEENLEFSMEDGPPEFTLDPNTGMLSGQAPDTELNKTYLITLTVTNTDTQLYSTAMFRFEIIGSLLLETAEGRAFFAKEESNFWDASKAWELQLFIQHLITEHYAWVMMYDESKQQDQLGELLARKKANSGWDILEFENAIMVTPGDKAFELYGNRRRVLDTLREAMLGTVIEKNWERIEIAGSDSESISKCWVIAMELELPVHSVAPSYMAEVNYFNIRKVFAEDTPSKPKPSPSSS